MRLARASDSEDILRIYEPFITSTAVSFETTVPSINEFSSRISTISEKYPFLVYEIDNKLVGYAYASNHRDRAAYMYDVDVSIYVLPEYHGAGISSQLYNCLFALLAELGYKNAYAAYTEPNIKSMKFHDKFGFIHIGTHHQTGYKFGKWHDVTWLEKTLSEHDKQPKEILAINQMPKNYLDQLLEMYTVE